MTTVGGPRLVAGFETLVIEGLGIETLVAGSGRFRSGNFGLVVALFFGITDWVGLGRATAFFLEPIIFSRIARSMIESGLAAGLATGFDLTVGCFIVAELTLVSLSAVGRETLKIRSLLITPTCGASCWLTPSVF